MSEFVSYYPIGLSPENVRGGPVRMNGEVIGEITDYDPDTGEITYRIFDIEQEKLDDFLVGGLKPLDVTSVEPETIGAQIKPVKSQYGPENKDFELHVRRTPEEENIILGKGHSFSLGVYIIDEEGRVIYLSRDPNEFARLDRLKRDLQILVEKGEELVRSRRVKAVATGRDKLKWVRDHYPSSFEGMKAKKVLTKLNLKTWGLIGLLVSLTTAAILTS